MPNNLDREQFRQDVRDVNWAGRRAGLSGIAWLGIFLLVVAVIGGSVWGFKVATAPAKGAGDVVLKDQDANNRVAQQRAFVNMFEGVKAADRKLQVLANSAAANPADPKARADLDGTQLICLDQVADYNAKVQETLAARWLPADLPQSLGADLATDCQPDVTPSAPATR